MIIILVTVFLIATVASRYFSGGGFEESTVGGVLSSGTNFQISVSPNYGSVVQVDSVATTVSAKKVGTNTVPVSFICSDLPAGATCIFSPASCTPTCNSTLTITTSSTTPPGSYTIKIIGDNGRRTRAASFSLIVNSLSIQTTSTTTTTTTATTTTSFSPNVSRSQVVLGDYAGELRNSSGRVSVSLMIDRLTNASVNTYAFLLWHKPTTDWEDLRIFLETLEKRQSGMNVLVYLVPPSENCTFVLPYGCNFKSWASAIANLSLTHKNVKGWAIDDFFSSNNNFTESYTAEFTSIAKSINPDLEFYPIVYYTQFRRAQPLYNYANYFDGIIFPYYNLYPSCSLTESDELNPEITFFDLLSAGKLRELRAYYPSYTTSNIGDSVSFTSTVSLSNPSDYNFSFSVFNSMQYNTTGYHFIQFLVNNNLAWEQDISSFGTYQEFPEIQKVIDLSKFATNTATLTFKMIDKQRVSNYPVSFRFYVDRGTWSLTQSGAFSGSVTYYNYSQSNLSLIVMVYDKPASFCGNYTSIPTPGSVYNQTSIALQRTKNGDVTGVIQYVLDLKNMSDGSIYDRVKQLYSNYIP